jgi:hypothetical protein
MVPNGYAFGHLKHAVGSALPLILGVAVAVSRVCLKPVVADVEKPAGPHNSLEFVDDGLLVVVSWNARQDGKQHGRIEAAVAK